MKNIMRIQCRIPGGINSYEWYDYQTLSHCENCNHLFIHKQSSFNDLITRNYATVEKRGQLSDDLMVYIAKIKEELNELIDSIVDGKTYDPQEAIDLSLIPITMLIQSGYNVLSEMEKKVIFNENRED
jgi:hypothetical protein